MEGHAIRVRQLKQYVGVARLGRAPAGEVLAAQLGEGGHQIGLLKESGAVFGDHLGARAVESDLERVPLFAPCKSEPRHAPPDVDGTRRHHTAAPAHVDHLRHRASRAAASSAARCRIRPGPRQR